MGVNNHKHSEVRWNRLVEAWCADFGPEAAAKIMQSSIAAIGGERMTFPSLRDLQRRERARRICTVFCGNYQETAARFDLSEEQIRRIIQKQRMIDRSKKEND